MTILVDTGPLVALLNQRDQYHHWAVEQVKYLKPPFYTCEAVMTEVHFLLARFPSGNRHLNRLAASGKLNLSFAYQDHLTSIHMQIEKYGNIPMSFADACLVQLAETHRRSRILTLDSNFSIYRTTRDKSLSTMLP
jgi:predicted nucleic acid-binding protein